MALQLSRLLEKVSHLNIQLKAGEMGLTNNVSWVHMAETLEVCSFLEGDELIITTGLGLQSEGALMNLVEKIHEKHASGLIVNLGPYLKKIPADVLDYCNNNNLPLLTAPWEVRLSEIMRILCYSITKEHQKHLETAFAFKNALFFPEQKDLYVIPLAQRDFETEWRYSVCVMNLNCAEGQLDSRLETLVMSLNNYARNHYQKFAIFQHGDEIIVITADYIQEEVNHFIEDLVAHSKTCLLPDESITLGVGRLTKSIRCLYKSYNQAKAIQQLQRDGKISPSMIHYSQMGLYRLLMGIEDNDIIQDYFNSTIGILVAHDAVNDGDLCTMLRTYLNHNGSVKDTAAELYVHRNTVNYKLNKIETMLNVDLSNLSNRIQLMIAFMLHDITA